MLKIINHKKSLIGLGIKYFIIYALVLAVLLTAGEAYVYSAFYTAFGSIDNVLKYRTEMANEEYDSIPIDKYNRTEFIVYDRNGRNIYSTSGELSRSLIFEDTKLLPEHHEGTYYRVLKEQQSERSHIMLMERKNGNDEIINWSVVEKNPSGGYTVKGGKLFAAGTFFSDSQFELFRGEFSTEEKGVKTRMNIEKEGFTTENDEQRILVVISPRISNESYYQFLNSSESWYLMYGLFAFVVTIIMTLLLRRELRRAVEPLNEGILAYRKGETADPMKKDRNTVKDFDNIADNFNLMVGELEAVKAEREMLSMENRKLIADISHDLKTPLTVIAGYSRALADGLVPEDRIKSYLEVINEKAALADELIETFFGYSKLQHPDFAVNREQVEMCEFLQEYLISIYHQLEESGFGLEVDIPEEKIPYLADVKLMRRAVDNLVQNSIKHNSAGTDIYAGMSLRRKGGSMQLLIEIGDSGKGIPEEMRESIFRPFVTENSSRESGKGTGLGLSIAEKIVKHHGGTIELTSKGKYRTLFRITLPYAGKV